jgi:hypothetical protein
MAERRRVKWPASALVIGAWLCSTSPARADLEADVALLRARWQKQGKVLPLGARLLERGDIRPILLPNALVDPRTEGCTSVAVLGVPSATFVLHFLPGTPSWPSGELPEASVAGGAQLVRCGVRRAMLSRLAIEMRSPRAVLEVVVGHAPEPLPSLRRVLEHRDPGPIAQLTGLGPAPVSAPLELRARAIEQRVQREGAGAFSTRPLKADAEGRNFVVLQLAQGCHRVDVLGSPGPGRSPRGMDIDAILRSATDGAPLATDRTESADASLALCVGTPTAARVDFVGAIPDSDALVLHARWALPGGLPEHWGPDARAAMADAVRRHHRRSLGGSPVYTSLGVQGMTALPVEVEPGACYLAGVTAVRGEPLGIALAVSSGLHRGQNHAGSEARGTALAFCAGGEERALIEVEARGSGIIWILALWETGRQPIGEVTQ